MIELHVLVWVLAAFFAYMGSQRGWTKELISMAGIVLGLFAMYQFDGLIRVTLLGQLPPDQRFYLQSLLFLIVVFFAYQSRALVGHEATRARTGTDGRDPLQSRVLGGIAGLVNGYLVGGTIWYFLDINRTPVGTYPLDPYVVAPVSGSASALALQNLPLYVLTQNSGGGDLLSLAVVILFIIVLVII